MRLIDIIREDLHRYEGKNRIAVLFSPTFLLVLNYRLFSGLKDYKLLFPLLFIMRVTHKVLTYITGIQFSLRNKIGAGLFFPHHGCIVIAEEAVIGDNCTILHNVTIGRDFGQDMEGCPVIGNNVCIFSGSMVYGRITIGNHVIIGANSVVNKSCPDNSVWAGVPAKQLSSDSSISFNEYWGKHFRILA